ncbi:MAG: SRPBCC family protein [Deltaproteobacteria bacterium]
MRVNRHAILVHCPPAQVVPEIVTWGEAGWWPRGCLMRFIRLTDGPVAAGTRYRQQVRMPFAPSWEAQVTEVTAQSITRSFLNGMFSGSETVCVREEAGAARVTYAMTYEVRGAVNRVLWPLVLRRLHDANIRRILENLKRHCERPLA